VWQSAQGLEGGGEMIAVIFEVWPKADRKQDYLNIAAELKHCSKKSMALFQLNASKASMSQAEYCRFHFSEMRQR
jgi:hypothetical protein